MTRDELSKRLRQAFTSDGAWNVNADGRDDKAFWAARIDARPRGNDPWAPYARDEYPETAKFPEV